MGWSRAPTVITEGRRKGANRSSETQADDLLLAQMSHFDPAQELSDDSLTAASSSQSISPSSCPISLSHYVVAATLFLVNAPALQDGQGFTVMRPVHLDTTERDACSLAVAPMEPTAILSPVLAYVPQGSW